MSLESVTALLLTKGLKLANELYMKETVDSVLRPRYDGLRYVISQKDKKYLVVTSETHQKVTEFANKKRIKLIEATRVLIGLGMLAHFNADPKDDPRYTSLMEMNRLMIENWQKNHPDQPIEETLGMQYWERMEADILRGIVFPDKKRRMPKGKEFTEPEITSNSRGSGLKDLLGLGLLFGGGWIIADYQKLKKENEELRRIIGGKVTPVDKHVKPSDCSQT